MYLKIYVVHIYESFIFPNFEIHKKTGTYSCGLKILFNNYVLFLHAQIC